MHNAVSQPEVYEYFKHLYKVREEVGKCYKKTAILRNYGLFSPPQHTISWLNNVASEAYRYSHLEHLKGFGW